MSGKREVKVVISGDPSGGVAAYHKLDAAGSSSAKHAEGIGSKIGGAFSKAGSMIGGEFGEIVTRIGEGIDSVNEKSHSLGKGLMAAGGVVAGLGVALQTAGSKDKQANEQLKTAIDDTGRAASDYREEIEKAIKTQANYGHSASDTQQALEVLTEATQDPKKAFEEMAVVENLAAAKHESLAEAGTQVAKVYGGAGRILKQYGITLESSKTAEAALVSAQKQRLAAAGQLSTAQKRLTDIEEIDRGKKKLTVSEEIQLRKAREAVATASENLKTKTERLGQAQAEAKKSTHGADDALAQLNKRLSGQAAASVDSFGGRIDVIRAKMGNWIADFGQRYGPAFTASGPVLFAAGMAMDLYSGHVRKAALAQAAQATEAQADAAAVVAADEEMAAGAAAAEGEMAAAAEASSAQQIAANDASTASMGRAKIGAGGMALGIVGIGLAAAAAAKSISDQQEKNDAFAQGMFHGALATGDLTTALVNNGGQLDDNVKSIVQASAAHAGLTAKAAKAGITTDQLTAGITGNKEALAGLVQQWKASGKPSDATIAGLMLQAGAYHKAEDASRSAANTTIGYADSLRGIPKTVSTSVSVVGTARAKQVIQSVFDYANGQTAVIHVVTRTSSGAASGGQQVFNAAGSDYFQGGMTGINEAGPELVDLPRGSAIHNTFASADMLAAAASEGARRALQSGGGGDQLRPINLTITVDGKVLHQSLLKVRRDKGGVALGLG